MRASSRKPSMPVAAPGRRAMWPPLASRASAPPVGLWSAPNLYVKGKYVADHEFDLSAVSKQCGTAVILKPLQLVA